MRRPLPDAELLQHLAGGVGVDLLDLPAGRRRSAARSSSRKTIEQLAVPPLASRTAGSRPGRRLLPTCRAAPGRLSSALRRPATPAARLTRAKQQKPRTHALGPFRQTRYMGRPPRGQKQSPGFSSRGISWPSRQRPLSTPSISISYRHVEKPCSRASFRFFHGHVGGPSLKESFVSRAAWRIF